MPVYTQISDVGPPHARVFTMECRVWTIIEEGIATTKKEAKHLAAVQVLKRLRIIIESDTHEKPPQKEEFITYDPKKVEEYYYEHSKLCSKKLNLGIKVNDYHLKLKSNFSEEQGKQIIHSLLNIASQLPENDDDSGLKLEENFSNVMTKFREYTHTLEFEVEESTLEPRSDVFNCAIQILSGPDIFEFAIHKVEIQAKIIALKRAIQAMILFLS